jgi:diguanylate cyclase (GGDEF)-like protein
MTGLEGELIIDRQLDDRKYEIKKVLAIEDNPEDIRMIQEMLTETMGDSIEFDCVRDLLTGIGHLADQGADVVLLDLSQPDSQGLDTFLRVYAQVPDVPVIVLVGPEEESLGVKATQMGAHDYFIKGQRDSSRLDNSIQYAIEQHKIHAELRSLKLIDELTGLYSRQAFLILSQHYLKLANRTNRGLILLLIKLEDIKNIIKDHGQKQGDQALIDTANVLKQTLRRSDIIAHLGSDEFVILALEAHKDSDKIIINRLCRNLDTLNANANKLYKLSVNTGSAYYDPRLPCSIAELMARVCKSLCGIKS